GLGHFNTFGNGLTTVDDISLVERAGGGGFAALVRVERDAADQRRAGIAVEYVQCGGDVGAVAGGLKLDVADPNRVPGVQGPGGVADRGRIAGDEAGGVQ